MSALVAVDADVVRMSLTLHSRIVISRFAVLLSDMQPFFAFCVPFPELLISFVYHVI